MWESVNSATRTWLMDHNGEVLSDEVVLDLIAATGVVGDPVWLDGNGTDGPTLRDDVIDRIEAVANGE